MVTALGMFTFGSITPEVLTEAVMCTTMFYPIIHRPMAFTGFTQNPTYIPVSMIPLAILVHLVGLHLVMIYGHVQGHFCTVSLLELTKQYGWHPE